MVRGVRAPLPASAKVALKLFSARISASGRRTIAESSDVRGGGSPESARTPRPLDHAERLASLRRRANRETEGSSNGTTFISIELIQGEGLRFVALAPVTTASTTETRASMADRRARRRSRRAIARVSCKPRREGPRYVMFAR